MKYLTDEFQLCFCFSTAKYYTFFSAMVLVKEKRLCLGWHLIKLYIKDNTQNAEWALFFVYNPEQKKKSTKQNKQKQDRLSNHSFLLASPIFINNSGVVVVTLIGCCLHVSCTVMPETSFHITMNLSFKIRGEENPICI